MPIEKGTGDVASGPIETDSTPITAFVLRSTAETVWSVLFTTNAVGFGSRSSTATPVGWLPTAIVVITLSLIRLISETELLPVFAMIAYPSTLSMATAEGFDPTGTFLVCAPGIEAASGVTPRFKAEINRFVAGVSLFCTIIGYKPGVPTLPAGIDTHICLLLNVVVVGH